VNTGRIFQVLQIDPQIARIPAELDASGVPGKITDLHKEAKRCFRKLAMRIHPDKDGSGSEFRILKEAYEASKLIGLEYREPGNYVGIVFGTRDLEVVDGRSSWAWIKNARGWRIGYTRHPGWGHDTRSSTDVSHRPPFIT